MDSITLTFEITLNVSVQVGDVVYYLSDGGEVVEMGACTSVTSSQITCDIPEETPRPTASNFIFFKKSSTANISTLTGYYAQASFKNDSTEAAELFAVSSEIYESS